MNDTTGATQMAYGKDSYIDPELVSRRPRFVEPIANFGQIPQEEIPVIGGDWNDPGEDYSY